MEKYFWERESKTIRTIEELRDEFNEFLKTGSPDEFNYTVFEDYMENAIEWQDVVPLDSYDMEKLSNEKCYFCSDSSEILSETELREGYAIHAYGMDYDSYEEFISAVTAPWESLVEMN